MMSKRIPLYLVAITIVLCLAGCKKDRARQARARIAEFNKCTETVFKSARPDERAVLLGRCVSQAKLFGRAGCNRAWHATAAAAPDERWRLIAVGCGRAYCPSLKAPKPKLCSRLKHLARTEARPKEWHEFFRAVLRAEAVSALSEEALNQALRALSGVLLIRVLPPKALKARPAVAKVSDPAFVIEVRADGSYWMAGKKVDRDEIRSRFSQASAAEKARGVVFKAVRSAPKKRMIELFELLEQAGITRFAVTMRKE
jgi:biopolymer transport protein ExbD